MTARPRRTPAATTKPYEPLFGLGDAAVDLAAGEAAGFESDEDPEDPEDDDPDESEDDDPDDDPDDDDPDDPEESEDEDPDPPEVAEARASLR